MTMIALLCVDKGGRRKFLMAGAISMAISIFVLGVVTYFNSAGLTPKTCSDDFVDFCVLNNTHINTPVINQTMYADISNSTSPLQTFLVPLGGALENTTSSVPTNILLQGSTARKAVAFVSLMAFVAAYSVSFGPGK